MKGTLIKQSLQLAPDEFYAVARLALDYIQQLENAIRDSNDWLKAEEGVDLMYYYEPESNTSALLIKELIKHIEG